MKFLFSALVLMMLCAVGCSTDDTDESVVNTCDVAVENTETDVVEDTTAATDVADTVDSTEDVTTVEEED